MEKQRDSPPAAFGPVAGALDLSRLLHIVLRRWWLPVLGVALTLGAAAAYLFTRPTVYTALAVVQVEQQEQRVMDFKDGSRDEDYRSADVLKTFEQVLGGGSLLLRVVKANHLDTDSAFAPPKPGHAPYGDGELIERMQRKIGVGIRHGTRLIDITATDRNPAMACRLARSMVDEYRRFDLEQKVAVNAGASDYLLPKVETLKLELEKSEGQLAKYRADNQAVSLEDKQNIVVDRLRELNQQVTEAKSKRLALESDIAKVNAGGVNSEQLLQLASINTVPAVADLRRQINQKEGEFAAIRERYMYKHIKYIEAEKSLEKLRSALQQEAAAAAAVLNRSYQSAVDTENKLASLLRDQEKEALQLDQTALPYKALLRQTETNRAIYENVLTRVKQAGVAQGGGSSDVRLVQEPTVPYQPDSQGRSKVLAIALAAGLFLGFAGIFILEMLNHTLQTVDQAEQLLGLPLLVAVPELRQKSRHAKGVPLVGAEEAPQREAFRTLRTILAMFKDRETRSFLFTSAIPGEGKSFCSLNFATALAHGGSQTLLLDADLRRSADYVDTLEAGQRTGLSECLAGKLPFAQVCHPTKVRNLFLCPAGERSGEPADLLTGPRLGELIREALQVFDRVVIDSPPVNAVSDCQVLAAHVDAVCLVARARETPVNAILRACRTLAIGGVTPVGFILNRMSTRLGSKSAYYYYGAEYHEAERKQAGAAGPS